MKARQREKKKFIETRPRALSLKFFRMFESDCSSRKDKVEVSQEINNTIREMKKKKKIMTKCNMCIILYVVRCNVV